MLATSTGQKSARDGCVTTIRSSGRTIVRSRNRAGFPGVALRQTALGARERTGLRADRTLVRGVP
jgi:hypothetical protein